MRKQVKFQKYEWEQNLRMTLIYCRLYRCRKKWGSSWNTEDNSLGRKNFILREEGKPWTGTGRSLSFDNHFFLQEHGEISEELREEIGHITDVPLQEKLVKSIQYIQQVFLRNLTIVGNKNPLFKRLGRILIWSCIVDNCQSPRRNRRRLNGKYINI
mgnify:FL=1